MEKQFSILLLCCFSISIKAQPKIDSLWSAWNNPEQYHKNRLAAINTIIWRVYLSNDPDSGFYYAQMQYDLAKACNSQMYMAIALNNQGVSFRNRAEFSRALTYYHKGFGDL